jgi:Domain of unknown function (DUF6457)
MPDEPDTSAQEFIDAFAAEIGTDPPDRERFGAILKLAATAAHASERTAAPVACYLAGLTGRPLDELDEIAQRIAGDEPRR